MTPSFTLPFSLTPPGHRRSVQLRRIAAGALVVAALVSALWSATRTDPVVLTFARDLPVGATLTAEDLRPLPVPDRLLPAGALTDPEGVVGEVTVTGVGTGELVTERKVTGPRLLASLADSFPEGVIPTVVPVRLVDPSTASLLRHGDTVNIVTSPGTGSAPAPETEAPGPVVVAGGGRVVVADPEHPDSVLIAFDEQAAQRVAAASLTSPLAVVLTHGQSERPAP